MYFRDVQSSVWKIGMSVREISASIRYSSVRNYRCENQVLSHSVIEPPGMLQNR